MALREDQRRLRVDLFDSAVQENPDADTMDAMPNAPDVEAIAALIRGTGGRAAEGGTCPPVSATDALASS